jgi:hypothetical protein
VIRHYDGTNAEQISAQSKRGAIWAVEWTHKKHRICLTRKDAEKAQRAWVAWKKRLGWNVIGHRARSEDGKREGCFIVKYDPHTRKVLEVS